MLHHLPGLTLSSSQAWSPRHCCNKEECFPAEVCLDLGASTMTHQEALGGHSRSFLSSVSGIFSWIHGRIPGGLKHDEAQQWGVMFKLPTTGSRLNKLCASSSGKPAVKWSPSQVSVARMKYQSNTSLGGKGLFHLTGYSPLLRDANVGNQCRNHEICTEAEKK